MEWQRVRLAPGDDMKKILWLLPLLLTGCSGFMLKQKDIGKVVDHSINALDLTSSTGEFNINWTTLTIWVVILTGLSLLSFKWLSPSKE